MKPYHKIQTVYKRDPYNNYKTLLDKQWALPEFEYLKDAQWLWTEKIDGTNIRVHWDDLGSYYWGRTDKAEIPVFLMKRLDEIFTDELRKVLLSEFGENMKITFYGEGYGNRIQKGGRNYIPDGVNFILFDIMIDGLWLERKSMMTIAFKLGLMTVPWAGIGTLSEAIERAKKGFVSPLGLTHGKTDFSAEGLVCRPLTELQNRRGHRIITKIKTKDFS